MDIVFYRTLLAVVAVFALAALVHFVVSAIAYPKHWDDFRRRYRRAQMAYYLLVLAGALAFCYGGFSFLLSWAPPDIGRPIAWLLAFFGGYALVSLIEKAAHRRRPPSSSPSAFPATPPK